MLKYQFLLSLIVLLGAIGVYSQLQQHKTLDHIDEQGQYEVHKRVTRADKNQHKQWQNTRYNKHQESPPPAHSSKYQPEFTKWQGRYNVKGEMVGPSSAHRSSWPEIASIKMASTKQNMDQGNREQQFMKMGRSGFLPLQEKLKDQQYKAASNKYESVIKYTP